MRFRHSAQNNQYGDARRPSDVAGPHSGGVASVQGRLMPPALPGFKSTCSICGEASGRPDPMTGSNMCSNCLSLPPVLRETLRDRNSLSNVVLRIEG